MSEKKLKTAVLGLTEAGQVFLEAASKNKQFQIDAVADENVEVVKNICDKYNCQDYSDYRQLIIQNRFDCLVVTAGVHNCAEHIKTAMKKKTNILMLPPPARNFQEAAELAGLADEQNVKFVVANTKRFAKSYLALRKFLDENPDEQIYLINAECYLPDQSFPVWQTDPKLAGGGVLLCNCYQIIDQILWNFQKPQWVYSLCTSKASDKQQRLYRTEDIATVTMKFTDTSFCSLSAGRGLGPKRQSLMLHSKNRTITVSDTRFTVSEHSGDITDNFQYSDDSITLTSALLDNFAAALAANGRKSVASSIQENLLNMAVIESAYLSARTSMPEQPERVSKIALTPGRQTIGT